MANLYLTDTYLTHATLEVTYVEERPDGNVRFALNNNIARPKGGGQPADKCRFFYYENMFEIIDITKQKEKPFLTLYEYNPYFHPPLRAGDYIGFFVDHERRLNLSKSHTLTHLVMASIRRSVANYESRGADISEDTKACSLWFASGTRLGSKEIKEIDMLARSVILDDLEVTAVNEKSIDSAKSKYEAWRVDDSLGLSGKIRTILIGSNWDANPCSGTHVKTTGEIGAFSIEGVSWNSQRHCWEFRMERCENWRNWYHD